MADNAEIKDAFKTAVEKVYNTGELDKIALMYKNGYSTGHRKATRDDKKTLKHDREFLKQVAENGNGFKNMPVIPLIVDINNADVWKSIICFMLGGAK